MRCRTACGRAPAWWRKRLAQADAAAALSDADIRAQLHRHARDLGSAASRVQALALVREAAFRALRMRPYPPQLLAASLLLGGKLAEMQTGEGKTLSAGLAAAIAALAGMPVHVVTVNDYLAERDAARWRPLYEFLGLRVGAVLTAMGLPERRAAYGCDITYCTNKELVFDYLKDSVAVTGGRSGAHLALDQLARRQAATPARCCAACTSPSSTRPTASSSTKRARR